MSKREESDYALETAEVPLVDAPVLNYRPPRTRSYAPGIAVIGAGGISFAHLDAYRSAGYDVRVICNRTLSKAIERRDAFFPFADISDDFDSVIRRNDIDVVDITTHPVERASMIESALRAGKHVLSQKPFVLDLDAGLRLVDIAEQQGLKLAVNQNGRWAPHLGYMREAVTSGAIGDLVSCHIGVHWNHGWIRGTPFENIDDLVFQDFAIHWFDFLASMIGNRATSVIATRTRASGQSVAPPLLAQALVQFEGGAGLARFRRICSIWSLGPNLYSGDEGQSFQQGAESRPAKCRSLHRERHCSARSFRYLVQ